MEAFAKALKRTAALICQGDTGVLDGDVSPLRMKHEHSPDLLTYLHSFITCSLPDKRKRGKKTYNALKMCSVSSFIAQSTVDPHD